MFVHQQIQDTNQTDLRETKTILYLMKAHTCHVNGLVLTSSVSGNEASWQAGLGHSVSFRDTGTGQFPEQSREIGDG